MRSGLRYFRSIVKRRRDNAVAAHFDPHGVVTRMKILRDYLINRITGCHLVRLSLNNAISFGARLETGGSDVKGIGVAM
jgi:hypothetical protein